MGEEVSVSEMTKKPLSSTSTHFILVHGVSHGAWCWYKVRTLLESSGHTVTCVDLKASGIDRTDVDSILSFQDYNQPLVDIMTSLPNEHKVILVGHSAGGISVTDAIHKFPDKIQAAVYVAASMLNLGFQTDQDVKDGGPDISELGDAIEFGFGLGKDEPPTSAFVKQQSQREIFYQLSPIEDCTLASMLLRPFPLAVTQAKLEEGKESSERVARIYIKTLQDRVIKPNQQDAMIKRWPPLQVYAIDTDHSPFFSTPFVLSGLLAKVAHSL
ncbi:methylesterase 17-like [Silene latifolia]|uniref:methylesterase 17-like n=1 Tax=Silene latifolia TaxID=37657 RepID=UPI003D771EB2